MDCCFLSQYNMVDPILTSKCPSKCLSHTTSLAIDDNAWYSDSAEDFETVPYFTDFNEISASPRNTQNPVIHLRVSKQLPLHQAGKCKELWAEKIKPCHGADLRYWSKWETTAKWVVKGVVMYWLSLCTAKVMSGPRNGQVHEPTNQPPMQRRNKDWITISQGQF